MDMKFEAVDLSEMVADEMAIDRITSGMVEAIKKSKYKNLFIEYLLPKLNKLKDETI